MSPREIVILFAIFLSAWYIFPVSHYLSKLRLSDGVAFLSVVIFIAIAVCRSQQNTNSEEMVSDLRNLPFIFNDKDLFKALQNPVGEGAEGNKETVVLQYRHENLSEYDEVNLIQSFSGEIVSFDSEDLDWREEDTIATTWTANVSDENNPNLEHSGEALLLDDNNEHTCGKSTNILDNNANKHCGSFSDREVLETLDALCNDKQVKMADCCYLGINATSVNRSTEIVDNSANKNSGSFSDREVLETQSKGTLDGNCNGKHVKLDDPSGLERIPMDSLEIIIGSHVGLTGSDSAKTPSHDNYAEVTGSNSVTAPPRDGCEQIACSNSVTASALEDYDKALDDALLFEIQKHRANADSMKALMVALMSPEELNRQADAFIAKFKEQMVAHA